MADQILQAQKDGQSSDLGALNSVGNINLAVFDEDANNHLANKYGGGKSAYAGVIQTSGDNVVITPSLGNSIRVFWVSFIPDPDNVSNPVVTVKIGESPIYVGYAMAHWEIFEGGVDESVVVNLETAQPVAVTIHYQEV